MVSVHAPSSRYTRPASLDVKKGDKGPRVTALQQDLHQAGYGHLVGRADGDFGNKTLAGLRAMQDAAIAKLESAMRFESGPARDALAQARIALTNERSAGVFGAASSKALREAIANNKTPPQNIPAPVTTNPAPAITSAPVVHAPSSVSAPTSGIKPTLRQGSKGPAVVDLQLQLARAGFSPGAADGDFGPKTAKAVRDFQRAKGLTADGVVGKNTWAALQKSGPAIGAEDGLIEGGPTPRPSVATQPPQTPSTGSPPTDPRPPVTTRPPETPSTGSPPSANTTEAGSPPSGPFGPQVPAADSLDAAIIYANPDKDKRREATLRLAAAFEKDMRTTSASHRPALINRWRKDLEAIGHGLPELSADQTKVIMASLAKAALKAGTRTQTFANSIVRGLEGGLLQDKGYNSRNTLEFANALEEASKTHSSHFAAAFAEALDRQNTDFAYTSGDGSRRLLSDMVRGDIIKEGKSVREDFTKAFDNYHQQLADADMASIFLRGVVPADDVTRGRHQVAANHRSKLVDAEKKADAFADEIPGMLIALKSSGDSKEVEAFVGALTRFANTEAGSKYLSSSDPNKAQEIVNVLKPLVSGTGTATSLVEAFANASARSKTPLSAALQEDIKVLSPRAARSLNALNIVLSFADGSVSGTDAAALAAELSDGLGTSLSVNALKTAARGIGGAVGLYELTMGVRSIKANGRVSPEDGLRVAGAVGSLMVAAGVGGPIGPAIMGAVLIGQIGVGLWRSHQDTNRRKENIETVLNASGTFTQDEVKEFTRQINRLRDEGKGEIFATRINELSRNLSARAGRHVSESSIIKRLLAHPNLTSNAFHALSGDAHPAPRNDEAFSPFKASIDPSQEYESDVLADWVAHFFFNAG